MLPLLAAHQPGDVVCQWRGERVTRERFLAHVHAAAKGLPDHRFAINLCEDRYLFLVAFAAVMLREQTNLLPSSRVPRVVADVIQDYRDSYVVTDGAIAGLGVPQHLLDLGEIEAAFGGAMPGIRAEHVAALVFTSGSTGRPQANEKRWGELVAGAFSAQRRFAIGRAASIVATVPPQHMYGLETSIMLPLVSGAQIHGGRPFFAEDVRSTLASMPAPRVLITTPIHLKACTGASLRWPKVEFIISATAPLSRALAVQTEKALSTRVLEIYGCTESGSIASRRTCETDAWMIYPQVYMRRVGHVTFVGGGHLSRDTALNDDIRLLDEQSFELIGRSSELVNIAGKRAILGDLNQKLNEIDGVEDGVFCVPEAGDADSVTRLVAVVVAPTRSRQEILSALARRVDPAFLPRPLYMVDRLPRSDTGKLPRAELLALIARLKERT